MAVPKRRAEFVGCTAQRWQGLCEGMVDEGRESLLSVALGGYGVEVLCWASSCLRRSASGMSSGLA